MSIYGSLPAPDEDCPEDCGVWVEDELGSRIFEATGTCTCGKRDTPLIYQGSHHLPSDDDPRGGWVDIAMIPAHVRFWRENPDAPTSEEPEGSPDPFLRFGVNEETVVLTPRHVRQIHSTLGWWLGAVAEAAGGGTHPRVVGAMFVDRDAARIRYDDGSFVTAYRANISGTWRAVWLERHGVEEKAGGDETRELTEEELAAVRMADWR